MSHAIKKNIFRFECRMLKNLIDNDTDFDSSGLLTPRASASPTFCHHHLLVTGPEPQWGCVIQLEALIAECIKIRKAAWRESAPLITTSSVFRARKVYRKC